MAAALVGPFARLLGVLAGLLFLAGCALAPGGSERPTAAFEPLLRQAVAARERGDLARSAPLYEQAAAAAPSPKRDQLRLQAARLYLQLEKPQRARALWEQTRRRALPARDMTLRRLVQAELALAAGDAAGAVAALNDQSAPIPEELQEQWLAVAADARLAAGEALTAAQLRSERDALLHTPSERRANRQKLWSALLAVPMSQLVERIPPAPNRFGGWLELAYFYRTRRVDLQALTAALHAWEQRYPEHHVDGAFLERLLNSARRSLQQPEALALLLPLSGSLAAVGSAVQHGFLAAYYQDPPQQRPKLYVYDIGDGGMDSLSAYQDAVAAGANVIIGPLTKDALQRLTVLDFASPPILALNRLPPTATSTEGLYQFGLAPEDDAFAAAELAWQRGYETAVSLTPNSDWGERVANAFQQRFQALGGRVLERTTYSPGTSDFGDPIEALLNLDVSTRRYKQLRALLRRNIQFQPRRRRDMDCLFIGAFPREARLIRPQLRFHHGIGVPIIATAQAYEGTPQSAADRDMDGLLLADIPWLLQGAEANPAGPLSRDRLARIWPENTRHFPRLYALGMDAYRLAPIVALMQGENGLQLEGQTGRLTIDANGVIHRDLRPAHFVKGVLQPLAPPAEPPDQQADTAGHHD